MTTSKKVELTKQQIKENTFKQVEKYDKLNFFEQYAMYMGLAQLFEAFFSLTFASPESLYIIPLKKSVNI